MATYDTVWYGPAEPPPLPDTFWPAREPNNIQFKRGAHQSYLIVRLHGPGVSFLQLDELAPIRLPVSPPAVFLTDTSPRNLIRERVLDRRSSRAPASAEAGCGNRYGPTRATLRLYALRRTAYRYASAGIAALLSS